MNLPDFGLIASGCMRFNQVSNSDATTYAYIYNNTFGDNGCQLNFDHANAPLTAWNGTAYYENNHFIGFSNLASTHVCGGTCTFTDYGNEVFQTTAAATSQGYTAANNYAPTSSGGATIGAGASAASSCATFSSDSALCSGTSGAVAYASGSGGEIASYPAIPIVLRTGAWDAGAYQFGIGATDKPNPPAELTAVAR